MEPIDIYISTNSDSLKLVTEIYDNLNVINKKFYINIIKLSRTELKEIRESIPHTSTPFALVKDSIYLNDENILKYMANYFVTQKQKHQEQQELDQQEYIKPTKLDLTPINDNKDDEERNNKDDLMEKYTQEIRRRNIKAKSVPSDDNNEITETGDNIKVKPSLSEDKKNDAAMEFLMDQINRPVSVSGY